MSVLADFEEGLNFALRDEDKRILRQASENVRRLANDVVATFVDSARARVGELERGIVRPDLGDEINRITKDVEDAFNALDERVGTLAQNAAKAERIVKQSKNKADELKTAVRDLNSTAGDLRAEINALRTKVRATSHKIGVAGASSLLSVLSLA